MRIILIETSTVLTSVALADDGKMVAYRESETPRSQASLTAVFVDEVLKEAGLKAADCDAVCLSMGPGSYTGLRVGSSTAKGLCFGAGIPLLAVGTLDVIAAQAIDAGLVDGSVKYIVPMIDARRMEVYTAVFSADGRPLDEVRAMIVDASSFEAQLAEGKVLFVGDGALKCKDVITSPNAVFAELLPTARGMLKPATEAFRAGEFRDIAYFEPFYLKQFVATVSAKKLF